MSAIDNTKILESIASLEKELAHLKEQLGAGATVSLPAKKERKPRNPDAKPNPWIQFKGKVQAALKEAAKGEGNPATVAVLFCKHLKDENPEGAAYAMETDAILAAYDTWATPEVIEHAKSLKRSKKEAAEAATSETESVADAASEPEIAAASEKKERKKPAPLTDEQKAEKAAKAKATREANKAKKDVAETKPEVAETKPEVAETKPKKTVTKKVTKKEEYTLDQLKDFEEFEHEGATYGRNVRGDVMDGDCNWVGHWDGKGINTDAKKPADFDGLF